MAAKRTKALAIPLEDLSLEELYGRADKDPAALALLNERLEDGPDRMRLDYMASIVASMSRAFQGDSQAAAALMVNETRRMKRHIAGPNPTPLESLLAERVAICQAEVSLFERNYHQKLSGSDGMSAALSLTLQRRIDMAHRRYLNAVRTLAQVRRLQLPAVQVNQPGQVNIGAQQTNVAAANPAAQASATDNAPAALPAAGCTAGALNTLDATLPAQDREPATVTGNAAR